MEKTAKLLLQSAVFFGKHLLFFLLHRFFHGKLQSAHSSICAFLLIQILLNLFFGHAGGGLAHSFVERFRPFPVAALAAVSLFLVLPKQLHSLVTLRTPSVGLDADTFPVSALPVLTNQHFAPLSVDAQHKFTALGTPCTC